MAIFTTLRDGFNGTSIDTALWDVSTSGGVTVTQNDQLIVTPVNSASQAYGAVTSDNTYDLTNSLLKVKVVQTISSSPSAETYLKLKNTAGTEFFLMSQSGTRLYMTEFYGGSFYTNFTTYSPTTHLWWQISHATPYVYWETSADGVNWTVRGIADEGHFNITALKAELGAGTNASVVGLTTGLFDSVNINTYTKSASGTLVFSGGATRKLKAYRSASGTLTFSGNVLGIQRQDPSRIEEKRYLYKVYDTSNTFLGVWDDVVSDPSWSEELNSAGSSMSVTLARNSDSRVVDFSTMLDETGAIINDENSNTILTSTESRNKVGAGSDLDHNYRVDLYVYYGEEAAILDENSLYILDENGEQIIGTTGSPNGVRRFTGFVSEINIQYGNSETTQVQLMSYGFDLDQYPVMSGANTTVAFNSYDPSNIVKGGMDLFIAQSSNTFTTYTAATIDLTGTVVSYTFKSNTYLELIKKSVELAPTGWYWHVDLGTNEVVFRQKASTPHHYFYLGKHIQSLNLRSYIGDVVNDVIFTGGGDPALYNRYTATPAANTRRGLKRLSDNRVTLDASAQILSEGEINDNNKVQYRSTVTILDKTYDIESIKVGEVVAFRNFGNYVDSVTMQIVAFNYTPDAITLQLDTLPDNTNKRLEDLRRSLKLQENETVPVAP
jgi:hypothetical protein